MSHRVYSSSTVKLNWELVGKIREEYSKGGVTYATLANKYNIDASTVGHIIRNETWVTPESEKVTYRNSRVKLSQEIADTIREQHRERQCSYKELSKEYDVAEATIGKIIRKEMWFKHATQA